MDGLLHHVVAICVDFQISMMLHNWQSIAYLDLAFLHLYTGPPVFSCPNPPPPIDTTQFFIIVDMDMGCDLCIGRGIVVDILTIMCVPTTSRPTDCVMTTPNGTNVLDINDPDEMFFTIQRSGDSVSSISISPVANPDQEPLGYEVLGTWTCRCNNSDGRVVASSTLGDCSEL